MPSTKVDTSSNPVSIKSLSIQSNSGRTPSAPKKAESPPAQAPETEPDSASGVSKDKCALAMSFFANDSKKPAKNSKKPAKSDELPSVQNNTARPFMKERAYYEPEEDDLVPEEEELPDFGGRGQNRDEAPPIPARSEDNKSLMMLRLMKNATNALRS